MVPWKLPLAVAAIAIPIVAGFMLGGPGIGVAVGALVAFGVLAFAAAQRPRGAIVPPPPHDLRRHVLLVVTGPIDDPAGVGQIASAARLGDADEEAEVLVLAPAHIHFLDRWASDVASARQEAQESLVATVAALAKAGVAAEARVGDADVVQAVEDTLQSFPATQVVLVSGTAQGNGEDAAAAAELKSRLGVEFRHLMLSPPWR